MILFLNLFLITNLTQSQITIENVDVILEFSNKQTTEGNIIDSNYVNIFLSLPHSCNNLSFELNNADMSNITKSFKLNKNLLSKEFKNFDDTIGFLIKHNISSTFIKGDKQPNFEILIHTLSLITGVLEFDQFKPITYYNIIEGDHKNILLFENFPTFMLAILQPFQLVTVIPNKKSKKKSLILKTKIVEFDYLKNKYFGISRS